MSGDVEDETGRRSDGFDAGAFVVRVMSSSVLGCWLTAHGVPPLFARRIAREFVNAVLGPPSRTERLVRGISWIEYWDDRWADAHDRYSGVPGRPSAYHDIFGVGATASRSGHGRSREDPEVNRDDHNEILDGAFGRGTRLSWGGLSRSREDLEISRDDYPDMRDCR
jgi:hypothetical protein